MNEFYEERSGHITEWSPLLLVAVLGEKLLSTVIFVVHSTPHTVKDNFIGNGAIQLNGFFVSVV